MRRNFPRNRNLLFADECGAGLESRQSEIKQNQRFSTERCTEADSNHLAAQRHLWKGICGVHVLKASGCFSSVAKTTSGFKRTRTRGPIRSRFINIFLFLEVRVVRDMDHRRVGYGCGIRTLLFSSFGNLFLARDTFLHYNDSHFSQLALPAFSSSSFLFFVKILFQLSKFSIITFNKCGYSF